MAEKSNKLAKALKLREQIAKLREEEKRLIEARKIDVAKLAAKFKLDSLSDAVLKKEFEDIAKRHNLL